MRANAYSDVGPFAIVPEWILMQAGPTALRVWCLLCRYSNHENAAWPSQETMADKFSVSVDTIQRAIRELSQMGAIQVDSLQDGMKRHNLYFLNFSNPETGPQKCGVRSRKNAVSVAANLRCKREPIEREPIKETGFQEKSRDLLRETLERVR